MSDYQEILYSVDGPSAVITLNRPDALNALTNNMMTELKHALAAAEQDEQVVGIILTGAGRGFCAGMDMNALDAQATGGDLSAGVEVKKLDADPGDKSMGENFQVAFTYIMSIRKPIIVALNGACAGLGMSIALLCDMRFSSENGKFVTAFAQRGLIAEHGQSWILPRLIGSARALDLLWSSRKVAAEEAMQMGLVNRIIPQDELLNETKAYIQNLADNCSPTSLMMMKQQVYRHMNAPLGEAMKESNKWMAESLKRQDFKEGVASYLEKRSPAFDKINM
ncbi:MAG: enoyl-CoA hydratase [Pseudomonadales bacterium]|jgi:enoyl-CoA hydratase/carnithine racemase|tara:strand:- start:16043 stop:16882 length:840 start_codon:yes stop_codon:yes gene_type:complete